MTGLTQMSDESEGAAGRRRIHLREISGGEGEHPLETVGQNLRAARLRRGDEIAAVSRELKIRKDHLAALEQDRLEDLPGKTYAIGFIRTYARYLGLDAEEMVERFKQEIAGRADEQGPMAPAAAIHHDERRLPYGWRIVAAIVILLLGYGVWHILSADRDVGQAVPPPPVLNPPKVAANTPAPPVTTAVPSPAVDSVPLPKPSPDPTPTNPTAAVSPAIGSNAHPDAAAVPVAAVPPGQVFGAQNKNARVVLRSRGTTHIEVHGRDGMIYINRTLNSGDSYQLPNIVGLTLTTTNGGAVEVDLDGLAMGQAGGALQPVGNVSLDPQAIVDRFNRHSG
jgi:cytoskeleton protein RodZ